MIIQPMSRSVSGFGSRDAEWAIVGEAPGYWEDKEGRPFVGPSGKVLREALSQIGLDLDSGYVTNVVKIRPPGNKTPGVKQINAALPALVEELSSMPNLRCVLLLGNTPLKALTNKGGVTRSRGTIKSLRPECKVLDGVTFFSTLHPAMILRNNNYKHGWVKDLASFRQLVEPYQEDVHILVNPDKDVLKENKRSLGAIDIETTVGEIFNKDMDLVSVAITFDGDTALVYDAESFRAVADQLTDVDWIMHNGAFDRQYMAVMEKYDLVLKHDTMAVAYLMHEEDRKSLEFLSSVYLGHPPYKGVDYDNILDETFVKVAEMNGLDACLTFRLLPKLLTKLTSKQITLYNTILMPLVNSLIDVTNTGVPVDKENLSSLWYRVEEEIVEVLQKLRETTPDPRKEEYGQSVWKGKGEFNPNSPEQVSHVMFDIYKFPVIKYTDTGKPSADASVLAELKEVGTGSGLEWLERVSTLRTLVKRRGYLKKWDELLADDGRLHPRYKPLFVVTGRLSSSDPNIQQVPREEEYRNVFGGVEGKLWMKADYSQVELRIAAFLSQEERMLEAYRNHDDLHMLTAELVLGERTPEARQIAKTLNFGLLYGAGAKTLKSTALKDYGVSMSISEAKAHRAAFFNRYSNLVDFHRSVEAEAQSNLTVTSMFGRVRHFPDANHPEDGLRYKALREAVNHPVQSPASDLLVSALIRVHEKAKAEGTAELVATVHDEMDALVDVGTEEYWRKEIKVIMEDIEWTERDFGIKFEVPIVADVTCLGTHWGGKEE